MGKWIYGFKSLKAISERGHVSRELPNGVPYDYALALDVIPRLLGAAFTAECELPEKQIHEIGEKWVRDHVLARHSDTSYLRALPDNEIDYDLHRIRVTDLAELLYNLQTVTGIDPVYRRLVDDPSNIEATILELEGFRLLWLAGLPFRVVHTGAGQNLNYECEVTLPSGITAYCEMKCKLETTEYSENSLKNALDNARGQLPKDGCGIILLKIPQTWVDGSEEVVASINHSLGNFLRATSRISEVVWYSRPTKYSGEWGFSLVILNEYLNENSPHVKALEGGLFHNRLQTAGQTRWVHLVGMTKEKLHQILTIELGNSQ